MAELNGHAIHDTLAHDPSGKALFALPEGVVGDAQLSDDGLCRFILTRQWSAPGKTDNWLWIGLNPSTATPDMDDPTIRVEWNLTQKRDAELIDRWAEMPRRYTKMNVLPFRVTDPANLDALMMGVGRADREEFVANMQALAAGNFLAVIDEASRADRVIVCWGKPRSKLIAWQCFQLLSMLKASYSGVLWCVGTLEDNWPAHPLRRKCVLQPYRVEPMIGGVTMLQIMSDNTLALARNVRTKA